MALEVSVNTSQQLEEALKPRPGAPAVINLAARVFNLTQALSISRSVVLRAAGPRAILNAQSLDRVLIINANEHHLIAIVRIDITRGINVCDDADGGAGVFMTTSTGSNVTFDDCSIYLNKACSKGGGIAVNGNGRVVFTGGSIYSNEAVRAEPFNMPLARVSMFSLCHSPSGIHVAHCTYCRLMEAAFMFTPRNQGI